MTDDDDLIEYLLQIGAMRPEEQRIARRRAMAEALRSRQYGEGRMVGGRYVPPSTLENLSTLAANIAGVYGGYKADKEEQDLLRRRREALEGFVRRRRGVSPAVDYGTLYGSASDEPGY